MTQLTSDILALVFGNITIIMTIAIEFPQLFAIFKTKNTSGTALSTYILFMVASFLWVAWASANYYSNASHIPSDVTNGALYFAALFPALISNTISVILVGCILFLKLKHLHICKKLKMTELDYSKILFDNQKGQKWIKKYYPLFIIGFVTLLACVVLVLILCYVGVPTQVSEEQHKQFTMIVLILNTCAAVFFELTSWPQFIKCMKTRDTSGISLGWAIFLPLSCITCFSYDLFLGFSIGWFNVLASLICSGILINIAVLVLKIINITKAKKLGLSEWTYTKRYIATKKKH